MSLCTKPGGGHFPDTPAKAPEACVICPVFHLSPPDLKVCVSLRCEQTEQFPLLTWYPHSFAQWDRKSLNDKLPLGAANMTDTALLALLSSPSEGGMPECLKIAQLTSTSILTVATAFSVLSPFPYFPLCFIYAHRTCQHWRDIHTSQDPVGTKSWISWCEMLWRRTGKRGMPLESKVHAASCTIYTHTIRMTFRILTTSSHKKEMRSSCPACGGDNESVWPELAPRWLSSS